MITVKLRFNTDGDYYLASLPPQYKCAGYPVGFNYKHEVNAIYELSLLFINDELIEFDNDFTDIIQVFLEFLQDLKFESSTTERDEYLKLAFENYKSVVLVNGMISYCLMTGNQELEIIVTRNYIM